ncbi:MAG TPA: hypothetical protein VER17_08195 [Tepidisphaeraceae bacterium]|nr:hypothetical protein [Tepidisphaeraceae bacterium]
MLWIEANYAWGGSAASFGVGTVGENPRKMDLHARLLGAIATGLEQLLAHHGAPGAAGQAWRDAEQAIRAAGRRARADT